uniref:PRMT5 arginine-N-methyltransferase domain-containing protein n=1 Tax=Plectus sambesii TaxID=2011161 RepID=A0A914VPB7_9BILA
FGDNELSPECLDGAQHIMKRTTINIPVSYTSYLTPVQSFKMRGTIWEFSANAWMAVSKQRADPIRLRDGGFRHEEPPHSNMDQPYVVRLHSYYAPSAPQPVFTF